MQAFADVLPAKAIQTDAADLAPHLTDWRRSKTGTAACLLLPDSVEQVQAIVRVAQREGIVLVPQGGNTGLVGGSVPEPASARPVALLSTRRLARIRSIDSAGLCLVAEAGVILTQVHEAAAGVGCAFPLSLGSKGSATIGGLVSTNAGGVQVLRHGSMRALVLGLQAVLPDGSLLDQLTPLRKDNSGYDIKQLLIGGEGTLGIVTAVALRLVPAPPKTSVAWAGVADLDVALALLARVRSGLGETVESFEVIDEDALGMLLQHIAGSRAPLAGRHSYHVLVEAAVADDALAEILSDAINAGEVADASLAASLSQAADFWKLRESIAEAERLDGGSVKNDISVAVADVPRFHREAITMLAQDYPGTRPLAFGHLGDGNLHFNIRPPLGCDAKSWMASEGESARRALHDVIAAFHGSISAEHGIGTLKAAELARLADPGKLAAMRAIKAALDPNGIMNPHKIFG